MNKNKSNYRDYSNETSLVAETYRLNHQYQTVEYVKSQLDKHCKEFKKDKLTIWEAIEKLDRIVDESDPDLDLPQIVHAFQTSEGLRRQFPDSDWMPLVGLIHDLGKIIALPEYGSQPQWATVGDTFPVACQFSDKIVYSHFFQNNPDTKNPNYNTKYGIYSPNYGLDNLLFSFGHDEYMYQVLKHNGCLIPEDGLKIIRYHSFYSWHRDGEYEHLMNSDDYRIRDLCQTFSNCDLYTKDNNNLLNINELKPYYQQLIDKYFPSSTLAF